MTIGLLAHVDAGKTTLSEALLYMSKSILKLGRVDHKDSALDYSTYERQRGITIYAKEARFTYRDQEYILEDTPGHLDFSTEMERVLPILDYAILIIDMSSGLKSYTKKIFQLLKRYHIPVLFFLNKKDLAFEDEDTVLNRIKKELEAEIINFNNETYLEEVAFLDEQLFEEYLKNNTIGDEKIRELFKKEKFYPCLSGSALKLSGIAKLLEVIALLFKPKEYPLEFKAYVYRINHDPKGNLLTYLKINGGNLKVKEFIKDEKADELRLYSGNSYKTVNEVTASELVAIKGLKNLLIGEYINDDKNDLNKEMVPFLNYEVMIEDSKRNELVKALKQLQRENPSLNVKTDEHVRVSLMGLMDKELLKEELKKQGLEVEFVKGEVNYEETILKDSYGIGHFEPLRHYAEVHLRLKPLKRGAGRIVTNPYNLKDNYLDFAMNYLSEHQFKGVKGGYPLNDVHISLEAIKTSLNHTVNDDVKRAVDFALRNALLANESVILEPFESFRAEVPTADIAHFIYLLDAYQTKYEISTKEDFNIIKGIISLNDLNKLLDDEYIIRNHLYIDHSFHGFDTAKVQKRDYDPLNDKDELSGSIFLKKGAGYYVSAEETFELAHIKPLLKVDKGEVAVYNRLKVDDEEVKKVFAKANPVKKDKYMKKTVKPNSNYKTKSKPKEKLYLVDGYNVLYAYDDHEDLESLLNDLSFYRSMKEAKMWVIFDAYKVNNPSKKGNDDFKIIYTPKNVTADAYIQRQVKELEDDYNITVISDDNLIQVSIFSDGAYRLSTRTLFSEIAYLKDKAMKQYNEKERL